jgi:hypothetical protein
MNQLDDDGNGTGILWACLISTICWGVLIYWVFN